MSLLTDAEIEAMAVKHEDFGFGQVDGHGVTTHGFDPEGLVAFCRAIEAATAAKYAERIAELSNEIRDLKIEASKERKKAYKARVHKNERIADLQAKLDAAAVDAEKYKFVLSGLSMEFAICEYDAHLNQWYQPSTPKEILSEIIGNAMRTGEPKV